MCVGASEFGSNILCFQTPALPCWPIDIGGNSIQSLWASVSSTVKWGYSSLLHRIILRIKHVHLEKWAGFGKKRGQGCGRGGGWWICHLMIVRQQNKGRKGGFGAWPCRTLNLKLGPWGFAAEIVRFHCISGGLRKRAFIQFLLILFFGLSWYMIFLATRTVHRT